MTKNQLLFLTILIEGYVVLAVELLAIRQLLPFVGSGVEIVAIVISGVLLPLAVGYHYGGVAFKRALAKAIRKKRRTPSIRRILLRNLLSALVILAFGLSYLFIELVFYFLGELGLRNRLWQTGFYTILFLVLPVFLLGQTVPLISNYFSRHRLSEITGRMLFFSTAGAFLGSLLTTLVLMMTIGVHNTVLVTLSLLFFLCLLLGGKGRRFYTVAGFFVLLIAFAVNNDLFFHKARIVSDNAYNIARIMPEKDKTILMLNNSSSSVISNDPGKRAEYIVYTENRFVKTMPAETAPHEILVIGAGGFTFGLDDTINHYTFVDIDPDLKRVAEDDFLKQKLPPTKQFVVSSARAFLQHDDKKYDLIFVDAYQNIYAVPMECITREFLQDVKARLKKNGVLVANIVTSADFGDRFSVRYDRTFSNVFPVHGRQIIGDYNPWRTAENGERYVNNILYSYFNRSEMQDNTIYTDDKNTYSIDRY